MRILVGSHFFYPSVGGIEMMGRGLAGAWQSYGHTVRVATRTPLDKRTELSDLEVIRSPSATEMIRLVRWADVFFRNGNAMRSFFWPLLTGTPFVTRHARPLSKQQVGPYRSVVERWSTHLGMNVATSEAVEWTIPGPVKRIPNTFRPVFDQPDAGEENREGLLFVGRLVSRKGVDVALNALALLHERGVQSSLVVCGDGPERDALERQAQQLGVSDAVTFNGWTSAESLAELYRTSAVALVPSRIEPFGIVALEAVASGCPVVASDVDGLPDALGDCGLLVPPERPDLLAEAIEDALQPEKRTPLREAMPAHVDRHRIDRIAREYEDLLNSVIAREAT